MGAYQYLLNWHKDYYTQNPSKKNPITPEGNLTTPEKKKILLNNIYGVDIDANAVEVTKLSLLLKCMEGETQASIAYQMTMFKERVLPTLDDNIKSGNSLIDMDYYDNQLDFGEERKIKPFSWQKAFPIVFKNGGFDVVIGNPPYVKEYTSKETFEQIKQSHLKKYYQGKMDLWYFFACYGIDLLKPSGKLGYIVPNNWVTNAGASILRNKILNDATIINIVDFGEYMVFENASIQTMILLIKNQKNDIYVFDYRKLGIVKPHMDNVLMLLKNKYELGNKLLNPQIDKLNCIDKYLVFGDSKNIGLLEKIKSKQNFTLDSKSEVAQGIVAPQDFLNQKSIDILGVNFKKGDGVFILNENELKKLRLFKDELEFIKPYFTSSEISRYFTNSKNKYWVIYTNSEFKNVNQIHKLPNIKKHLDKFIKIITSDNAPYGLHRSRVEGFFKGEKIVSLRKCTKPSFSFVEFDSYVSQTYFLIKSNRINKKYLTGLLNSNLIAYWLRNKGKMQGSNYQIDKEPILEIPIYNPTETRIHDQIITHVDQLLQLNKDLQTANLETKKQQIKQKIEYNEDKINYLVYQLYNLTDEEIKIIENK